MRFCGKMICSSRSATTTDTCVNVLVAKARQFVGCSGRGSRRAPMGFCPISFCHASGLLTGVGGRNRISRFLCAKGVSVALIAGYPCTEFSPKRGFEVLCPRESSAGTLLQFHDPTCVPNARLSSARTRALKRSRVRWVEAGAPKAHLSSARTRAFETKSHALACGSIPPAPQPRAASRDATSPHSYPWWSFAR
jgi:hypothetical protein